MTLKCFIEYWRNTIDNLYFNKKNNFHELKNSDDQMNINKYGVAANIIQNIILFEN